jgi:hypothetical protein
VELNANETLKLGNDVFLESRKPKKAVVSLKDIPFGLFSGRCSLELFWLTRRVRPVGAG